MTKRSPHPHKMAASFVEMTRRVRSVVSVTIHVFSSIHFGMVQFFSTYIVLLLVLMFWTEFFSVRRHKRLDFAKLLDELELVRTGDRFFLDKSRPISPVTRRRRALEAKEALRRMSGNARVLVNLARLHGSEVSPKEREFAREIREERTRLVLCVQLLRFVPPRTWHMPWVGVIVDFAGSSYWLMVRRLCELYCLYDSQRRCAALKTACNLAV